MKSNFYINFYTTFLSECKTNNKTLKKIYNNNTIHVYFQIQILK